jgi:hypothetical protein
VGQNAPGDFGDCISDRDHLFAYSTRPHFPVIIKEVLLSVGQAAMSRIYISRNSIFNCSAA